VRTASSPTSLDFYDAELRAHHEHLRAAFGISPGDQVLETALPRTLRRAGGVDRSGRHRNRRLPAAAGQALVAEWARLHRAQLEANWERARRED
jgi:hypothetical protein